MRGVRSRTEGPRLGGATGRVAAVVAQPEADSATGSSTRNAPRGTLNVARWNEILDAAGHVFHEKGYQAARIEDIASRVGILRGSLYYYIESKEDLLFALCVDGHSSGLETIAEPPEPAAADAPHPARRLHRALEVALTPTPSTPPSPSATWEFAGRPVRARHGHAQPAPRFRPVPDRAGHRRGRFDRRSTPASPPTHCSR